MKNTPVIGKSRCNPTFKKKLEGGADYRGADSYRFRLNFMNVLETIKYIKRAWLYNRKIIDQKRSL
jgi:hypothetical protein